AIIELAEKDGYLWLVSIVTQGNEGSDAIHEKFGFEKKAAFADFGYKMHRWTGVDYYVKKLGTLPDRPERPKNLSLEDI
ncbi:MAG: hypothetical protein IKG51_03695, partial [Firmicutes bacterium]|nr:hypothetical protein [Bacillota bacterium]